MMSCLESKGKVIHLVGYHQRDSWPVNMIGQTIIDGTVLKQFMKIMFLPVNFIVHLMMT